MSNGFEQLVTALQSRYDFQSARTMAREALAKAGLKEQPSYSKEEVQRFVDGLAVVGSNLDKVWSLIGVAPAGAPAPVAAPEAKPAPAPAKEEAKPADEKPADDKPADDKPAKKDKGDDKKDKGDDKKDDDGDDGKKKK